MPCIAHSESCRAQLAMFQEHVSSMILPGPTSQVDCARFRYIYIYIYTLAVRNKQVGWVLQEHKGPFILKHLVFPRALGVLIPRADIWPVGVPILCIPTLAFECCGRCLCPCCLGTAVGSRGDVNLGHCMERRASQIQYSMRPIKTAPF